MNRPYITKAMREAVARRYGAEPERRHLIACTYCGRDIWIDWRGERIHFLDELGRARPELDHVEPLYWGGPHTVENLVPACMNCNRSKGPRRLAVPL